MTPPRPKKTSPMGFRSIFGSGTTAVIRAIMPCPNTLPMSMRMAQIYQENGMRIAPAIKWGKTFLMV